MALPKRYDGKPLLLIMENYALAAIGARSPENFSDMGEMVRRVWGGGDDWMVTVRQTLGWNSSIDATIRKNWAAYQRAAREQGVQGTQEEFAMQFADAAWERMDS